MNWENTSLRQIIDNHILSDNFVGGFEDESGGEKFVDAKKKIDDFVEQLHELGLPYGSIVAVSLRKCRSIPYLFLALDELGLVYAPISEPQLDDNSARSQVSVCNPRLVICEPQMAPFFRETVNSRLAILKAGSFTLDVTDELSDRAEFQELAGYCYLNYTSGSTGAPKAAATTRQNLVSNTLSVLAAMPLSKDDRFLCFFPSQLHPHESFMRPLFAGATTILAGAKPVEAVLKIREFKPTFLMMNPTLAYLLARKLATGNGHELKNTIIELGGAPTPSKTWRTLMEMGATPKSVWGSTETSGVVFVNSSGAGSAETVGLGSVVDGYEWRIVNESGVPTKEGTLELSGPAVTDGYFNNPQANAEAYVDGWYRTGDVVRFDSPNEFVYVGRSDYSFKVSGMKVHPLEIESEVCGLEQIEDAVAGPVRINGMTEPVIGCIFVSSAEVEETLIRNHLVKRLGPTLTPSVFLAVSSMPKQNSGKIDRSQALKQLREHFLEGPHADLG